MFLLSSVDFLQNKVFTNKPLGPLSECQTVWIQIKTDILWSSSGLKLFAKYFWQMTQFPAGMQRVITGSHIGRLSTWLYMYIYTINIRTLEINFDMLCPLNKAKVIFK